MRIEIAFKHQNEAQLRNEFRTRTDNIIRAISWDLAFWLYCNYHITLLITCLWRSPTYNKKEKGSSTSRHLEEPCKAVDCRIRDWPKEAIPATISYLKDTWGDLIYVEGESDHIHIQLSRAKFPSGSLK